MGLCVKEKELQHMVVRVYCMDWRPARSCPPGFADWRTGLAMAGGFMKDACPVEPEGALAPC